MFFIELQSVFLTDIFCFGLTSSVIQPLCNIFFYHQLSHRIRRNANITFVLTPPSAQWQHWPAKKNPRLNFQCSVTFSPAIYEYESLFSPSRSNLSNFYNKGLKINKTGDLYAVFKLKLANKINVLQTWSVSQKIYFLALCKISNFRSVPSQKKNFKVKLLLCKGVYITLASIF